MKSLNTKDCVVMRIRDLGHCPAFKNKKIIARGRLITAPKARKWMEEATKAMYSQLCSLFQTTGGGTTTEPWQQSAIASLPSDDCWQQIPMTTIRVKKVPKGEEGVIVILKKISNKETQDKQTNTK